MNFFNTTFFTNRQIITVTHSLSLSLSLSLPLYLMHTLMHTLIHSLRFFFYLLLSLNVMGLIKSPQLAFGVKVHLIARMYPDNLRPPMRCQISQAAQSCINFEPGPFFPRCIIANRVGFQCEDGH